METRQEIEASEDINSKIKHSFKTFTQYSSFLSRKKITFNNGRECIGILYFCLIRFYAIFEFY